MASQINPTNIDITYPIAGQDNDTQGFRTNFTNIKNNFATAASEISQLQANSSVSVTTTHIPSSNSAVGVPGTIAYSTSYLYVCIATDTWLRANLATWSGPGV